jgi:tetratricopeptide (TPR) repeat protein
MSRPARYIARAVLVLLAPIVALLILESICRVFQFGHPTGFLIPFERFGEPVWVDNQLFGYRFFAPAVSRAPTPIIVAREKATNEFRIVVLGESAAMGEPEPAYGPARQLEYLLKNRLPGQQVTVINAAMTAINSHVIREISRDLELLKPDVVILYIGNNEVVGPYGPGTVFQTFASSAKLNRIRAMLTRMRLSSIIREFWFRQNNGDEQIWKGMEMFTSRHVSQTDPRLSSVYDAFEGNLRSIIRNAQHAGAKVILSTIAVNLLDQAPFDGSEMDATSLESLKQCRDSDSLRFRADTAINRQIRDIASNDSSLVFTDVETAFEKNSPPGFNYFLDHVHFNPEGGYLLASIWEEVIGRMTRLSTNASLAMDDVFNIILWNPFNAIDTAEIMLERSSRAPFTSTRDYNSRMATCSRELADCYEEADRQSLDNLLEQYHLRMTAFPFDPGFPQQAVRALLLENRYKEANGLLLKLHALTPHRADIRGWMAMMEALTGKTDRIWTIMSEGAPDLGQIPADLLVSASETLLQAGYRKESAEVLRVASNHFPHRLRLRVLLASRLAQAGQTEQSRALFLKLIDENPDALWIREEYGILLAISGNQEGAEPYLQHLQHATNPADQLKWIQFLLYQRKLPDAEKALMEILKTQPENPDAMMLLSQLYIQQNRIIDAVPMLETMVEHHAWRGDAWAQLGSAYDLINRPADAIDAYNHALPFLVNRASVVRTLAWMYATEENAALRDPEKADELINRITDHDTQTLLVRAAVHASNNRFEDAIRDTQSGLALLEVQPDPDMLDQFQRSLELYRTGQPIYINR